MVSTGVLNRMSSCRMLWPTLQDTEKQNANTNGKMAKILQFPVRYTRTVQVRTLRAA